MREGGKKEGEDEEGREEEGNEHRDSGREIIMVNMTLLITSFHLGPKSPRMCSWTLPECGIKLKQ